jgi:hypothetical protein
VNRDDLAIGVYRALIRLHPRRFRDEYGADMTQLMREQCHDESTGRVLTRAVIDAAISIPTQHMEARMRSGPNRLVPLVYITAAVAGLLVATLGGSEGATLALGLGLAVITGTIGVVSWRRSTPTRDTRPVTTSWWKFLVAGPCLVALVILAAGAGINAWYLGMVTILAAILSTTMGVILALAHLFGRRFRASTP